jgi:hypothetical protein
MPGEIVQLLMLVIVPTDLCQVVASCRIPAQLQVIQSTDRGMLKKQIAESANAAI